MAVVVITGGIGAGKTELLAYWQSRYAIPIFDTDDIGRSLLKDHKLQPAIQAIFPVSILSENGCINKVSIQRRIFHHPAEKHALESLLHPIIRQKSREQITKHLRSHPYCVVVVPLLYETGTHGQYDRVCVIESDMAKRRQRCLLRGMVPQVIDSIMAIQATSQQRQSIGHDFIYNNSSISIFHSAIDQLYQRYHQLFCI